MIRAVFASGFDASVIAHTSATVAAEDHLMEQRLVVLPEFLRSFQLVVPFLITLDPTLLQDFKGPPVYQRLMHILQDAPLAFIVFVVVIRLSQIERSRHPPEYQVAGIGRIHADLLHAGAVPFGVLIFRVFADTAQPAQMPRRRNPFLVQLSGDCRELHTVQPHLENPCHHIPCLRIRLKAVCLRR